MDASEAFERSLGCGPEAIDQPGLLNSFDGTRLAICPPGVGPRRRRNPKPQPKPQAPLLNCFEGTRLAFCPPGVGPRRKENSRLQTKPQPFPPLRCRSPVRSLPSAHSSPPAQPVPASSSAPEVAQILRQWSYEQLMARGKQTPIILRLITNLAQTFQQSTDPDLRRETAAQLERIIYSRSWLIELPGVPEGLGVLANFRTGGKLGHTSSGLSDTASSAADPGLIDAGSSAAASEQVNAVLLVSGRVDAATSAADSGPADITASAADPGPADAATSAPAPLRVDAATSAAAPLRVDAATSAPAPLRVNAATSPLVPLRVDSATSPLVPSQRRGRRPFLLSLFVPSLCSQVQLPTLILLWHLPFDRSPLCRIPTLGLSLFLFLLLALGRPWSSPLLILPLVLLRLLLLGQPISLWVQYLVLRWSQPFSPPFGGLSSSSPRTPASTPTPRGLLHSSPASTPTPGGFFSSSPKRSASTPTPRGLLHSSPASMQAPEGTPRRPHGQPAWLPAQLPTN
ncbi:hypothetical protein EXN66_Car011965 [Channa argus]|uniref:Uncharacterized protein n=1 Tax=Channa argus TaxID=215402 RepID=A0A6G1Q206_CHAAH|nr:hypothetical protein EXN66_Car011965 [Channa argus]